MSDLKTYEVRRMVTLEVQASSRDAAVKRSKDWDGCVGMYSTATGSIEWVDSRSRFVGAKRKKD
jgi:hypothetical protein